MGVSSGGQNSSSATKSKSKEDDDSPKSDEGTSACGTSSAHSTTPPPVAYSSQSSNSSDSGNGCEQNGSKKKPERRLSSVSEEVILNFPLSVDSYSRASATGVEIRDRCRDLLVKALMKGFNNSEICFYYGNFCLCSYLNSLVVWEMWDNFVRTVMNLSSS